MANNRNFVFVRDEFGQRNLEQEEIPAVFPDNSIIHTIDLLELKEPFVAGSPTPNLKIGIKAPSLVLSYQLCMPVDVGTTGQILSTDGNNPAQLSWVTESGGGDVLGPGASTDMAIARWDGITGLMLDDSLAFLSDLGVISTPDSIVITSSGNTKYGFQSLNSITSGTQNTAVGVNSIVGVQTGTNNIALGELSGSNWITSNSDNIAIGNAGVSGDSGEIRLGSSGTHLKNFQSGIRGITTDVADALPVLIDSTGQLGTAGGSVTSALPMGYISDCKLSFNSNFEVDVAAGTARDATDSEDISIGAITLNINNTGALGLMTGETESSNVTYEIHLLHDDTDAKIDSAFLVPEGVTPAETGYSHFRYVGAVHNSGGSNFLNFYMGGKSAFRRVYYYESFTTMRVLNSGSATTWSLVMGSSDAVSDFCPVGSTSVLLNVDFEADVSTNANVRFRPEGDTGDHTSAYRVQFGGSQTLSSQAFIQIQVPLATSRDVEYEGSSASLDNDVSVYGYDLEL